jgi:hypothetical protein
MSTTRLEAAMSDTALCANMLDALAEARSADAALRHIDVFRRLVAGPGICSIQLNVTTADDPKNEVLLQRFYSSVGGIWPVSGKKRKTRTRWTETLFVKGEVFVGEGAEVLGDTFDDYPLMRPLGLHSAINVPILEGNVCFATFNVFGTQAHWNAQQVFGVRLLGLAAARWLQPAPDLHYEFETAPAA